MQERHEIIYEVTVQDQPGAAAKVEATAAALERAADAEAHVGQAIVQTTGVRTSAVSALNRWKAAADPVERATQQLERAERDLDRAMRQGLIVEREKVQILEQLRARTMAASAASDNYHRGVVGLNGVMATGTQRLIGYVAAFVGLHQVLRGFNAIIDAADAFKRMESQLRLVTDSSEELSQVQGHLFTVAQSTSSGLEATVQLYARLARSTGELAISQDDLLQLVTTFNQAMQISGATTSEASSAILQFSQAMASGVLRGEEFNSISENGSRVLRALSDAMGVTIGQLRDMAKEGELTADRVMTAMLSQADVIENEFASAIDTTEMASTRLGNSTQSLFAAIDEGIGISTTYIGVLDGMAAGFDNLSGAIEGTVSWWDVLSARQMMDDRVAALVEMIGQTGLTVDITRGTLPPATLPAAPTLGADPLAAMVAAVPTATRAQLQEFERTIAAQVQATQTAITGSLGAANQAALQAGLDQLLAIQGQIDARLDTASPGGGRGGTSTVDQDQRRQDSLENYIASLEDVARIEALSTDEKEVQEALLRAQEIIGRALNETEAQRVRTAVETTNAIDAQAKAQDDANKAQQEAIEQQRKQFEEAITRTTDDIVSYAADTFADLFSDTEFSWEKMWENLKKTAIQTLARIAAEALLRPIIQPIIAQLVGAAPSLFGVSGIAGTSGFSGGQGGGSTSGGSGGFSMPNIPGLGNLFGGNSGLGSFMNSPIFGTSVANPANLPFGAASGAFTSGSFLPGLTFGGALSGIGMGAGIGGLLASLTGGNSMGGTIGGGLGGLAGAAIGSIIPGLGTVLGSVIGGALFGALGGLFGGGKPSVGPNAGANVDFIGGMARVSSAGADNGGDIGSARRLAQGVADAMNVLAKQLGATSMTPGGYQFGSFGGQMVGRIGGDIFTSGSPDKIVQDALFRMLKSGRVFQGLDATTNTVLANTKATTLEGIISDIDFGKALSDLDLTAEKLTQAEQAIKAITDQFAEMTERAIALGLSEQLLIDARDRAIAQLTTDFDKAIELQILAFTDPAEHAMQVLAEAQEQRLAEAKILGADLVDVERLAALEREAIVKQSLGGLREWLDQQSITSTAVTGVGRLTEAQGQFGAILEAVRGGSATQEDLSRVISLADTIIGLAGQLYGGTAQHATLESMVRSQVESIGRELGLPGFAAGGWHGGGVRVVGEFGPEIENTGPARYWSAQQTAGMLGAGREESRHNARLMLEQNAELRSLRAEVADMAAENRKLRADMSRVLNALVQRRAA